MPQFEMQKISSDKCHETNHMGKQKISLWKDNSKKNFDLNKHMEIGSF